jgi:hypothetical protein
MTNARVSEAACRMELKWAILCLDAVIPPGFFDWLEWRFPKYHITLTETYLYRLRAAWGTVRFEPIVLDFLAAFAVAIAVYCLHGQGDQR